MKVSCGAKKIAPSIVGIYISSHKKVHFEKILAILKKKVKK